MSRQIRRLEYDDIDLNQFETYRVYEVSDAKPDHAAPARWWRRDIAVHAPGWLWAVLGASLVLHAIHGFIWFIGLFS